jgi:pyruvate dehydrogenase E2 component (dihydrolipoamide acetyltransferase)
MAVLEFKLPDIGEGVHEGEIVRWIVPVGGNVKQDEPVVEVMTDKATVEIPSPGSGVVSKHNFAEGAVAKVGDVLFVLEQDGAGAAPAAPSKAVSSSSSAAAPAPAPAPAAAPAPAPATKAPPPVPAVAAPKAAAAPAPAPAKPAAPAAGGGTVEFKLPDIGEGVHEGEIVRWIKKAGDAVAVDEPVVEVMTDKATVEIPSPAAGTMKSTNVAEGAIAKVGDVIFVIATALPPRPLRRHPPPRHPPPRRRRPLRSRP